MLTAMLTSNIAVSIRKPKGMTAMLKLDKVKSLRWVLKIDFPVLHNLPL